MRLLTDSNTSQRFVEILQKLGWDIQTAYEAGLAGKNVDVPYITHARKEQRIFLTFDDLRAEHGVQVAQELRLNGGKVIRVAGGPGQDDYRALGKLLFHYPEWQPFLDTQSGVAVWGGPHYLDRIGAILREGPAVLRGLITEVSGTKDCTRPPWVDSTGLEVNTSAGV